MLHIVHPGYVFLLVLLVAGADSMAYFVGRKLGKRKLAPTISPGKSVEGAYAGIASGLIIGASFFIGTVFATLMGSMAILNPAVALGTGSINFMYILGPIIGAIVGMWCYRLIVVVDKKSA